MTNKEAIDILNAYKVEASAVDAEAFDMAIAALAKEQKPFDTKEWVEELAKTFYTIEEVFGDDDLES